MGAGGAQGGCKTDQKEVAVIPYVGGLLCEPCLVSGQVFGPLTGLRKGQDD